MGSVLILLLYLLEFNMAEYCRNLKIAVTSGTDFYFSLLQKEYVGGRTGWMEGFRLFLNFCMFLHCKVTLASEESFELPAILCK